MKKLSLIIIVVLIQINLAYAVEMTPAEHLDLAKFYEKQLKYEDALINYEKAGNQEKVDECKKILNQDKEAFEQAKKANTIESLQGFTKAYPKSKFMDEATQLLSVIEEENTYTRIIEEKNIIMLNSFTYKYPESKHLPAVNSLIKQLETIQEESDYKEAKKDGTTQSLSNFIEKHPTSKYANEANNQIEQQKKLITTINEINSNYAAKNYYEVVKAYRSMERIISSNIEVRAKYQECKKIVDDSDKKNVLAIVEKAISDYRYSDAKYNLKEAQSVLTKEEYNKTNKKITDKETAFNKGAAQRKVKAINYAKQLVTSRLPHQEAIEYNVVKVVKQHGLKYLIYLEVSGFSRTFEMFTRTFLCYMQVDGDNCNYDSYNPYWIVDKPLSQNTISSYEEAVGF